MCIRDRAERLQDVGIKAISIHGRTRAQMYKGNANWDHIAEVKNNSRMFIPVFCNGDIDSPEKAKDVRDVYGFDGAMIGRAAIGNPWFFNQVKNYLTTGSYNKFPSISERVSMAKRHLELSIKWKGEKIVTKKVSKGEFLNVDLVLASAGGSISKKWLATVKDQDAVLIDNSSAFRLEKDVPLVVPEVNAYQALKHNGVIANPNCPTILLTFVLAPLKKISPSQDLINPAKILINVDLPLPFGPKIPNMDCSGIERHKLFKA